VANTAFLLHYQALFITGSNSFSLKVTTLRYSLQNKQFVILMKISSKMAFENFKNFISFHETFKTKFSTHISSYIRLRA